ncbi:phosphoribosyltransferase [Candidatus Bathyarchaeota archaeon]|nr:phosphoribosyltransferase [Candidatus Bathyarchaeota archaeon]
MFRKLLIIGCIEWLARLDDLKVELRFSPWREIFYALLEVAKRIRRSFTPDMIVGVLRGGAVPAIVLSDLLDVSEVDMIGVGYYTDIAQRMKRPRLTRGISASIRGKAVLIVDDITDTGGTIRFVAERLETEKPSELKVATIYCKPWAHPRPDFYYEERSEWIIFPWEVKQTVKSIYRFKGKDLDKVKSVLTDAGIEEDLIQEVWGLIE